MGEDETMVKHKAILAVDPEDLRIAKGIASFKGMTLSQYFRSMVDEESKQFKQEMMNEFPTYRRRNK
jgi:hypothetical protein